MLPAVIYDNEMFNEIVAAYQRADYQGSYKLAVDQILSSRGIESLHIAGLSLLNLRRIEEGMLFLKAAVAFHPNTIEVYWNAANSAQALCLPEELEYFCRIGLRQFPHDKTLQELQVNVSLLRLDYEAAVADYSALLSADPENIRIRINLANTLRLIPDPELAAHHFEVAAKIDPTNQDLLISRAAFFGEIGKPDEAMEFLRSVDHPDALAMHALFQLSVGDYQNGWISHKSRWRSISFCKATPPPNPFYRLDEIEGQQVAVLREGGFGDTFQFFRYIQMLAARTSEILLAVLPSELEFFRYNLPDNINFKVVKNLGDPIEIPNRYERTIALLDLPLPFETFSLDSIPATLPYLCVPDSAIEQYRLEPIGKRRVGLVWSGGGTTGLNERSYDARRSIPLHAFAEFSSGDILGVQFVNLQVGDRTNDSGLVTERVLSANPNWMETAAVIAQLDLVITVDTAIVHLAAAMGRPTWLLSRFDPCWRWLRNRPDSPWYPGVLRVFGQTKYNDWSETIAQVTDALVEWSQS